MSGYQELEGAWDNYSRSNIREEDRRQVLPFIPNHQWNHLELNSPFHTDSYYHCTSNPPYPYSPQDYYYPNEMLDPQPYNQHQLEPIAHTSYQASERVSTRILARATSSTPSSGPIFTGQKRPSPSNDFDEAPKAKKPRKAKPNPTTKRVKHPEIHQIIDAEDARRTGQIFPTAESSTKKISHFKSEVQNARCMNARYNGVSDLSKCIACTRRVLGISFLGLDNSLAQSNPPSFPQVWNEEPNLAGIDKIKSAVVRALLPTLKQELKRIMNSAIDVCYRPRESDCRATCDVCLTSIFSSSWICKTCGREFCNDCYQVFSTNTVAPPTLSPEPLVEFNLKRRNFITSRTDFSQCTKRSEHLPAGFVPVSRFRQRDLKTAIQEMEAIEAEQEYSLANSHSSAEPHLFSSSYHEQNSEIPPESEYVPPSMPPVKTPQHTMPRYSSEQLTESEFVRRWSKGIPIIVSGLLKELKIQWTPEYFMKQYGEKKCALWNCQTEVSTESTVAQFFSQFGIPQLKDDSGNPEKSLKLKDWPPTNDFRNEFKNEYEDFVQAVPMPNYTRPDGILNIASMFPTNAIRPDLGPKMYNAQFNYITKGSKGSTRLHMDMADAINIMPFATPDPVDASQPGSAAWDIFLAEDSNKIRDFLKKRYPGNENNTDPIHGQQYFLDESLRYALFEEMKVKSFRVYQRPGEAVFIPAGCAHQVCNLADCIKVAVDFVSPENISRCEQLTREFRNLNTKNAWKEDVLQLKTMMWFAWLCCRELEGKLGREYPCTTATIPSSNFISAPHVVAPSDGCPSSFNTPLTNAYIPSGGAPSYPSFRMVDSPHHPQEYPSLQGDGVN